MDCSAPVAIYLCLSSHSAGLLGFDTAREVRLNDMLGERQRQGGGRDGERGGWEKGEREKNEGREEGRGQMSGDTEGKEEEEEMRDRQPAGKRKATMFGCGNVRERSEHAEEKRVRCNKNSFLFNSLK